MEITLYITLFIFGLLIGSFLNVVIYRVPKELSIVKPRSACSNCQTTLKWYDLIPVISHLFLKGKCRYCKTSISFRYSFVELITGILTLVLFIRFGVSFEFLSYLSLTYILIACFFIDLDHMIIPNGLIITGLVLYVVIFGTSFVFLKRPFVDSLIGGFAGGGILLVIYLIGLAVYKQEALGFGDVKLFFVIGLYLGLKLTAIAFLFSIFAGAIGGILVMIIGKKDKKTEIPFGPFIVFGTILSVLAGDFVYNWYIGIFL